MARWVALFSLGVFLIAAAFVFREPLESLSEEEPVATEPALIWEASIGLPTTLVQSSRGLGPKE